jgi:two-component system, OmpR family, response regulator VanR
MKRVSLPASWAARIWAIVVAGGDQQRLEQLALGQLLAGPHRHDRLALGLGLRLGLGDGDREPVLGAAQRVLLKGQVGGHHLCQAGDRGRLLVRARRRPAVAEHQGRLSAQRPPDRRHVGAALVAPHVAGRRRRVGGELPANAAWARSRTSAAPTSAPRRRRPYTVNRERRAAVRAGCLEVTPPSQGSRVLPARICFSIRRRYVPAGSIKGMRVLIVEDEPYMAEAIRDGLRLEAIAADVAGDGDSALDLLSVNAYDIAVLDRDIPGPSGDEIAKRIVASGSGMPILMLTAADRLDDKASGFELGADDYLTKPFELRELVLRLRALDRRRAHNRPPVREIAGLRLDPFRREVYRDGNYIALSRKQFAVLEVLVTAEGGVVSAEELLERAWDGNADPFTNAVRITVSALRKRLGEPWIIATVAGAGYRIDTQRDTGREEGDRG